MADQQGRPDANPDDPTPGVDPAASGAAPDPAFPPAKKAPGAKKVPAKAAKKAPAKAAKKAPAKKAAKKAAPGVKKAPPKKAPPQVEPHTVVPPTEPPVVAEKVAAGPVADISQAAKEAAAQAKSAVASAPNPVSGPAPVPFIGPDQSRLPVAAAVVAGVLALLMVLVIRRRG